jgi:hypothetical protein
MMFIKTSTVLSRPIEPNPPPLPEMDSLSLEQQVSVVELCFADL